MDKLIELLERYYNVLLKIKPWQKSFNFNDEQRLLRVMGRIPAEAARVRVEYRDRFDADDRLQYVLKHGSTLAAVAAMSLEERTKFFSELALVLDNCKSLVKSEKRQRPAQPTVTVTAESEEDLRQARMKLSARRFIPLWGSVICRPAVFFVALRELRRFSTVVRYMVTLIVLMSVVSLGMVLLVPGAVEAVRHAMLPVALSLKALMTPTVLVLAALVIMLALVTAGVGTLLAAVSFLHCLIYRVLSKECSFFPVFACMGYALSPMLFLPLAMLYPPLALVLLLWCFILLVAGLYVLYRQQLWRVVLIEAVLAIVLALVYCEVFADTCASRWEAALPQGRMVQDITSGQSIAFPPGARVRVLFHNKTRVLGSVSCNGPENAPAVTGCFFLSELAWRENTLTDFGWNEMHNLGLTLWENVYTIRQNITQ